MATRPKNLGELERASYRSRWRDGLVDLLGGTGVLFVGITWHLEIFWAAGFAVPILILAWSALRKGMVEPRIGAVTFRKDRRRTEKRGIQGAALFGVGLLALFVCLFVFQIRGEGGLDAFLQEWIAGLPAALLALMALLVAAMTGLSRFIGYAAVLVACGSVGSWLGLEPGAQILIGGGIITLAGAILFARFLTAHPIPAGVGDEL